MWSDSVPLCSLVLVDFGEVGGASAPVSGASVRVVMGHAVQQVEVLQDADEETAQRLQAVFAPPQTCSLDLDPEQLRRRRVGVRRWLEKNRVPVQEDGEQLTVAGALTLAAPYGPDDCSSSNQIILDRIQKLLRSDPHHLSLPEDADQD